MVGDFAAAGSADIHLLPRVAAPFVQLTLGGHDYRRAVAGASNELAPDTVLLGAVEWMHSDGPWSVRAGPAQAQRPAARSAAARAAAAGACWRWPTRRAGRPPTRSPSACCARAVRSPGFGRFDSLDPTTGGRTPAQQRCRATGMSTAPAAAAPLSAYAIGYDLDLNSNFSYALERPAQRRPVQAARPSQHRRRRPRPCLQPRHRRLAGAQQLRPAVAARPHPRRPVRQRGARRSRPPCARTASG